jgi:hypothetical protein
LNLKTELQASVEKNYGFIPLETFKIGETMDFGQFVALNNKRYEREKQMTKRNQHSVPKEQGVPQRRKIIRLRVRSLSQLCVEVFTRNVHVYREKMQRGQGVWLPEDVRKTLFQFLSIMGRIQFSNLDLFFNPSVLRVELLPGQGQFLPTIANLSPGIQEASLKWYAQKC